MKFHLLVNPAAGRGRAAEVLRRASAFLKAQGATVAANISNSPGHLTEIAREVSSRAGGPLPVVCGGDGSFNEVANGLCSPEPAIGLIPAGRGNDIAGNLGIPTGVEDACRNLFSGTMRSIDLVSAGGRLFAGIGGAGVDSEVTRCANECRFPFPGNAVYGWAVLRTLASFRPYDFSITADEWSYRGRVMFAAVANSPVYGGGMRLSPHSRMDDGLVVVCIVEEMGRLELLRNFPRLYRGTHLSHPKVRLLTARRLRIESRRPASFYADGEYHRTLPVDIAVRPAAMAVMAPPVRD